MGTFMVRVADATPVRRGYEHYWSVVRALTETAETFTVSAILARCDGVHSADVRKFVGRLVQHGVAEDVTPVDAKVTHPRSYRLLRRPVDCPAFPGGGARRCGPGQQQMWNTMRYQLRGGFTLAELALFASTEEVVVSEAAAKNYVMRLQRAGLVQCLTPSAPHRPAIYKLRSAADTGPKAPRIVQARHVYDPNRQEIVGEAEGREVSA